MNNNFNPLSAEELTSRINKIPRVNLAQLPTVLEFAPNISKELGFTQEETLQLTLSSVMGAGYKYEPIFVFKK